MLELARAKAAQREERLAALATELFGIPHGLLTDSNRALMTGMLHGLVDSVVEAVRAHFAPPGAAHGRDRDALAGLARDAVMAPLRRSGVLAEPALIEAAHHRLLEFHLGALPRERSRARAPAPAPSGAGDVVATLFARADPSMRQALTAFLVGQAKRVDGYGNPLISFEDVPASALGPLVWAVAAAVRLALADEGGHDPAPLDASVERAAETALAGIRAGGDPALSPDGVAGTLVEAGLAGAGTLAPLLAAGEVALFEAVLGRLAGLDRFRLRRFLFEPGGEALAVCAREIRLGRDDLAAILTATAAARQRPRPVEAAEFGAALALYDRLAPDTVERLMAHWALDRGYLWMLARLEAAPGDGARRSVRR